MANSLTGRAKLLLGLAVVLVALMPIPVRQAGSAERTFRVEAGNYAYSPSVLSVNPGDRVTIELVATDVVHGLHIEGYDLSVSADPGQTARLSFVADRSGSFRFRCSVTCGPVHPFMTGKLNVGPNWLLWRTVGLALLAVVVGIGAIKR